MYIHSISIYIHLTCVNFKNLALLHKYYYFFGGVIWTQGWPAAVVEEMATELEVWVSNLESAEVALAEEGAADSVAAKMDSAIKPQAPTLLPVERKSRLMNPRARVVPSVFFTICLSLSS
jgi:hypothetical protein